VEERQLVANRFEVEGVVGVGGMGRVFRVRDRHTGDLVALKVLRLEAGADRARFAREARVLADLNHSAIVRYVAHGAISTGELYLAMEWLEGEDLRQRLLRGPLEPYEALALARRLAEALGAAHVRKIVHRDVKPSNIFLPRRSIEEAKLLDFGIARVIGGARPVSQVGAIIGTPGYMSPEQARGDGGVDARSDVFSLGCVLFESLAGQPPFTLHGQVSVGAPGHEMLAVLAKVLFDEPAALGQVHPELPQALVNLVQRMMSKRPDQRPADGNAVRAALLALEGPNLERPAPRERLSAAELRRLFVVIAAPANVPTLSGAATTVSGTARVAPDAVASALLAVGASADSRVERLADGSVIVTFTGEASATDAAARAARCALGLRRLMPEASIAVATGRGQVADRRAVGEAIERAVALLRLELDGIRIDEGTAGLLGYQFVVNRDGVGLTLTDERAVGESVRTLLGRPSPCVGRDRELAILEGDFTACVNDGQARAVLVTGPPGIGKTRLRLEFERRLSEPERRAEVWTASAEPLAAGSPFFLISQLLRRAAGILEGENFEIMLSKLRARVAGHVDEANVPRVVEFLGELAGVSEVNPGSALLSAARRDPALMADQTCAAWEEFLQAECRHHPLIIILENVHWGDVPSLNHFDWALSRLANEPLFVLALGRPEVKQAFPQLWKDRSVEHIALGQLPRRACERLVAHALGTEVSADASKRLVTLAAGNAFYLEELIRAVAEGRTDLPESVLAMAQVRYESLELQARQILRAAAIFGEVFWQRAVFHLLPHLHNGEGLRWLEWLVDRELVERRPDCRFQRELEYRFRHALLSEAAYAALTEEDRTVGHRLAAQWLEDSGELDPMTLAEHFDRGGEATRAISWYRRAAEHALEGGDYLAAQARALRAISCGAHRDDLIALKLVDMEALKWQGRYNTMAERASEIVASVALGDPAWCRAIADLTAVPEHLAAAERALTELEVAPEMAGRFLACAARVITRSYIELRQSQVRGLYEKMEVVAQQLCSNDPILDGWLCQARAFRALVETQDAALVLRQLRRARACFENGGDRRNAFAQLIDEGWALVEVGKYHLAEALVSDSLAEMESLRLIRLLPHAWIVLATVWVRLGRYDEAIPLLDRVMAAVSTEHEPHFNHARALRLLSNAYRQRGDLAAAERVARDALGLQARSGKAVFSARPDLARVLLALGRPAEALALVRNPSRQIVLAHVEGGSIAQRLVLAEALLALHRESEAQAAIEEARTWVLELAARVSDEELRDSFLTNVPDVRAILSIAQNVCARPLKSQET
jgi:eukaryotic-like serine/threonine-protein kinase